MKKLFLLIVLFVFAGTSILLAQVRVITGTITSAVEGEGAIPGVSVFVKGTTVGTITDVMLPAMKLPKQKKLTLSTLCRVVFLEPRLLLRQVRSALHPGLSSEGFLR